MDAYFGWVQENAPDTPDRRRRISSEVQIGVVVAIASLLGAIAGGIFTLQSARLTAAAAKEEARSTYLFDKRLEAYGKVLRFDSKFVRSTRNLETAVQDYARDPDNKHRQRLVQTGLTNFEDLNDELDAVFADTTLLASVRMQGTAFLYWESLRDVNSAATALGAVSLGAELGASDKDLNKDFRENYEKANKRFMTARQTFIDFARHELGTRLDDGGLSSPYAPVRPSDLN